MQLRIFRHIAISAAPVSRCRGKRLSAEAGVTAPDSKYDIEASDEFGKVKMAKATDEQHGFKPQQDDSSIKIGKGQVKKLGKDPSEVTDGNW